MKNIDINVTARNNQSQMNWLQTHEQDAECREKVFRLYQRACQKVDHFKVSNYYLVFGYRGEQDADVKRAIEVRDRIEKWALNKFR